MPELVSITVLFTAWYLIVGIFIAFMIDISMKDAKDDIYKDAYFVDRKRTALVIAIYWLPLLLLPTDKVDK